MNKVASLPHIIKYMGSKRNILPFVVDTIFEIRTGENQRFYDIFAGSAVVGGALREVLPVTCNDIQAYSGVIANVYLNNYYWQDYPSDILDSLVYRVTQRVQKFREKYYTLNFNYHKHSAFEDILFMEEQQKNLINFSFNGLDHLFTKNYSGTYWSYDQCVWIDAFSAISREKEYKNTFLFDIIQASLMFAMAYCSQSTGHYAQYRDIKENNIEDILFYRKKEILPLFEQKFQSLKEYFDGSNNTAFNHNISNLDYSEMLDSAEPNSIIYADPPYQFVHYSRFYHALETLVKYDYPEVKYKGRYRTDRHQSPFCIKTQVPKAFSMLFQKVYQKKSSLILSYSNSGMISLNDLIKLAKSQMPNYMIEIKELDYLHSTMGRQGDKSRKVKEVLIVCKY